MGLVNLFITVLSAIAVTVALGLGLYVYGGLTPIMSGIGSFLIISGLFQFHGAISRTRRGFASRREIKKMQKANAGLSEEVLSLREEVQAIASYMDEFEQKTDELLDEQLAPMKSTIESLEGSLGLTREELDLTQKQLDLMEDDELQQVAVKPAVNTPTTGQTKTVETTPENDEILDEIVDALGNNRADLYLQPMVTLPQRNVRYYEALTRLRGRDGQIIMPSEYLEAAGKAGIMPQIDNLLLLRSVKVLRRLADRNRKVGLFCNISSYSLHDLKFFPQFMDFLKNNRRLAGALNFEFTQAMVESFGPIEFESLKALADLGFRFSMDHVTSLDVDYKGLNQKGFRFMKVDSDILLNRMEEADSWIHTADLSALMERHGLRLIAEKVENERMVVNLLDYGISYAQGYLFGKPALVRGDILDGAGKTSKSRPVKTRQQQAMKMAV